MSAGAFFMSFDGYDTSGFYDEMFETDGSPRASARLLFERIRSVGDSEVRRYQRSAEQALFRMAITVNVYGDEVGTEKIFPFDIIPRSGPAQLAGQPEPCERLFKAVNVFADQIRQ